MYDRILIPTDGSDASTTAVDHGVSVATGEGADVHFLHVVDAGTEMSAAAVGDIADDLSDTLEEEAVEALDAAEERADDAGVASERTILEGYPEDAIVDYSADNDIDLVVIGESDESGVTERLFGSTTEGVVDSTPASVLIARE